MVFVIAYIYGSGKTSVCFSKLKQHPSFSACKTGVAGAYNGRNFVLVDGMQSDAAPRLGAFLESIKKYVGSETYYAVIVGNQPPDDVCIHMDHVFNFDVPSEKQEACAFLDGIERMRA